MDYLVQKYKEKCKKEYCTFGFKTYKNNFYRVVNDVYQSFQLHQSMSGDECTVEFIVAPLCMGGIISKSYCGNDHIKMFESDYSWFIYDRTDEESIDMCVDTMIQYISNFLLRYFANANDSKSAYFETCAFQQKYYKSGIAYWDHSLFCMSLKAGFYYKSIEHLKAKKLQVEYALKRNVECFGKQLGTEYTRKMANRISDIEYQIKKISQPDFEYINSFIAENEKRALLNLGIIKN